MLLLLVGTASLTSPQTRMTVSIDSVNPNLGASGHVYVTSSTDDPDVVDRLLVFSMAWPEGFAPPYALDVGTIPREGIAVNLDNGRVYVSARGDDQVGIVWDGEPVCPPNFAVGGCTVEVKLAE